MRCVHGKACETPHLWMECRPSGLPVCFRAGLSQKNLIVWGIWKNATRFKTCLSGFLLTARNVSAKTQQQIKDDTSACLLKWRLNYSLSRTSVCQEVVWEAPHWVPQMKEFMNGWYILFIYEGLESKVKPKSWSEVSFLITVLFKLRKKIHTSTIKKAFVCK